MIRFTATISLTLSPATIPPCIWGTNGTSYYFSVASGSIGTFFDEMYLNTPWEQHYENLDGRTILDRLASVKYFVIKNEENQYLPYGYQWLSGTAEKNGKTYEALQVPGCASGGVYL